MVPGAPVVAGPARVGAAARGAVAPLAVVAVQASETPARARLADPARRGAAREAKAGARARTAARSPQAQAEGSGYRHHRPEIGRTDKPALMVSGIEATTT